MKKRQTLPTPSETIDVSQLQLLSISQVCGVLGFGRTKIYDLIHQGMLPTVKIGGSTKIRVTAIKDLIEEKERAS